MSLLWIEGFESFGVTNGNAPVGLQQKYDNAVLDSAVGTVQAGRVTGHSMRLTTGTAYIGKTVSAGVATLIVGFGFYMDAHATGEKVILQFWDETNIQGTLAIQTTGLWKYYRGGTLIGSTGTLLGTSTGSALVDGTWMYVEIKVKFDGSTGTVDINIDGINTLTLTGQNTDRTGSGLVTGFMFEGSTTSADHTQFDDVYVCDTSGSLNNAMLGAQVVRMIVPSSDAGTNTWTPDSGGTHYNRLTENPQDTTTYLADSTTGHRELFGVSGLNLGSVRGLQINAVAAITDATVFALKNSTHTSGGTDTDQAAVTIADVTYQTVANVLETNPETSSQWAVSEVNSTQFGFKTG